MNAMMLQAENAQLRKQLQQVFVEKETYALVTLCLANLIRMKGEAKVANGQVVVNVEDLQSAAKSWRVGLEQANVKMLGRTSPARIT